MLLLFKVQNIFSNSVVNYDCKSNANDFIIDILIYIAKNLEYNEKKDCK